MYKSHNGRRWDFNFGRLGQAAGFSLMELLVVIGIIAALVMIAAPNLMSNVNRQKTRGQAMEAMTVMRQARLKASVAQKPVRVVVDCAGSQCIMRSQLAKYDYGRVVGWDDIAGTRSVFDQRVKAVRATPVGANPDGGATDDKFAWIIFAPEGKALSNPRPFGLYFYNTASTANTPGWRLTVDNNSGRAALDRHSQ